MGMPIITCSNSSRCEAITDIIQSVALEQAALSHILNAEGEKLQLVIASPCTTHEQLLETNNSVRSMVDSITRLELVLQSKLALFDECMCPVNDCANKKNTQHTQRNCNCSCTHEAN